jgi:hypothetical protein
VKTVVWGDHCGKFYLNQYGPSDAPIWRIERFACVEWERTYAKLEPPLCFKVSDPTNRMGEIKRGSAHKYGAAHFRGIHGVAFDHGFDNNPLININPDDHSRSEGEKFSSTYVIICWDRDLDNKAPIPCWETRTTARRVGRSKKDVDRKIYAKAMEMQVKFDELHKAGGSPDVPSPPRNVQTTRNRRHIAPTARRQTRSRTAVPSQDSRRNPARETVRAPPSSTVAVSEQSDDINAMLSLFDKLQVSPRVKPNGIAAVMGANFGEDWLKVIQPHLLNVR